MHVVNHRIVVMGPGNILGLEDVARIAPHSYSVRCVKDGVLLSIDVEKFHTVMKHVPNGFAEITRHNKAKWKNFFDKLTVLEHQKTSMVGKQRELI